MVFRFSLFDDINILSKANFNRVKRAGVIYIIQWLPENRRLQISTRVKIEDPKAWDEEKQQSVDKSLKDKKGIKVVDTLARYRSAMAEAVKECDVTRGNLKQTFLQNYLVWSYEEAPWQ